MKDEKPRIALVGPTYPYRGGIAQYNTQLHQSLGAIADLTTISFAKLYPGFLYPGESDIEHGAEGKEEPGVRYTVHIYKPWTIFRAVSQIKKSGAKVALINWWTLIWQPGVALLSQLLRWRGVRTVYICHNVFDHDGSGLKQKISKFLLKFTNGYIVHSSGDENVLMSYYKKPILNIRVLPVYSHFEKADTNLKKRGRLELLFFGFIRPYKGLEDLVTALSQLKDNDIYLTVVGESWSDPKELQARLNKINAPNVETHFKYVDDKKAAEYLSRADILVLPYKQNTASAVASLAYNYRKPILASDVEGLRDAVIDGETGWLVKPNSPRDLAKKLSKINRSQAEAMGPAIDQFCKNHSWSAMARRVQEFTKNLSAT